MGPRKQVQEQEESEAGLEGILCRFEEDVAFQEGCCQGKMTNTW